MLLLMDVNEWKAFVGMETTATEIMQIEKVFQLNQSLNQQDFQKEFIPSLMDTL